MEFVSMTGGVLEVHWRRGIRDFIEETKLLSEKMSRDEFMRLGLKHQAIILRSKICYGQDPFYLVDIGEYPKDLYI